MKVMASKRGFSLVELLTVIAIIAILASIIFPVMSMVANKARMNKCITQLHQIGLGVQMFKQDNRRYPDILATSVQAPGGNVVPFDRCGANQTPGAPLGLLPEYVKGGARIFHCPVSKYLDTTATASFNGVDFYLYDSYDFMQMPDGVHQHYARGWCVFSGTGDPGTAVKAQIPDDTPAAGNTPATGDATSDYERQLKFRTPPDNTVVTWCSNHETIAGTSYGGRAPVLYLDGHVDQMPAPQVEQFRYRLMPRKE